MKDRLFQLLEKEKISSAEFADRIGVQRSNVSHILNGRNNPGFSFIQKVMEAFPKVNPRWLITGEGAMESSAPVGFLPIEKNLFSSTEKTTNESFTKVNKSTEQLLEPRIDSSDNLPFRGKIKPERGSKNITRVLLFYDDNTFDDFSPTDKL
jgi:transcriptional regulator with XRE-family HTH domain